MRLKEGMNLAHRQGDSLLRLFPREDAYFGFRREHRALHGDGVGVRGDLVRQDQNWVLATTHEIARHGKEEVRVSFKHFGHELVGRLQRDLGSLSGYLRRPAAPKCALRSEEHTSELQ